MGADKIVGKNNFGDKVHSLTPEDRINAGKKSVEARRAKKQLKEYLLFLLESEHKDSKGNIMTGNEALAVSAFKAAVKGDWRAWELVRDTSGQKPVEKIVYAEIDPEIIAEVEDIVNESETSD